MNSCVASSRGWPCFLFIHASRSRRELVQGHDRYHSHNTAALKCSRMQLAVRRWRQCRGRVRAPLALSSVAVPNVCFFSWKGINGGCELGAYMFIRNTNNVLRWQAGKGKKSTKWSPICQPLILPPLSLPIRKLSACHGVWRCQSSQGEREKKKKIKSCRCV